MIWWYLKSSGQPIWGGFRSGNRRPLGFNFRDAIALSLSHSLHIILINLYYILYIDALFIYVYVTSYNLFILYIESPRSLAPPCLSDGWRSHCQGHHQKGGRAGHVDGTGDIREPLGIFSGDKMGHVMVRPNTLICPRLSAAIFWCENVVKMGVFCITGNLKWYISTHRSLTCAWLLHSINSIIIIIIIIIIKPLLKIFNECRS